MEISPSQELSQNNNALAISDDWKMRTTLMECNRYMLENKVACDVNFILGTEGQKVTAHKYVLISRSPVFHAMFYGPVADQSDEIHVPDIEPEVFLLFLRFLYYDDDTIVDSNSVMGLLYAAKKYSICSLQDICKQFLKENINFDNACIILEQAHAFDEKDLHEECLDFIWKNGEDLAEMTSIYDICAECMEDVISSDVLAASEKTVFQCAMNWSEKQCHKQNIELTDINRRQVLGNILYQVRFPLMPLSYFADNVSRHQILTSEEKLLLYEFLCQSCPSSRDMTPFLTRYRSKRSFSYCKRFKGMVDSSDWVQKGKKDAITFSCNLPILMHGICMYRSGTLGIQYDIRCDLFDSDEHLVASVHRVEHSMETISEGKVMFPVLFNQPIKITSFSWYTIVVKMIGPKCYYGERGRKKVLCSNVTFEFLSAPEKSSNSTNVYTGQIPVILFSTWL